MDPEQIRGEALRRWSWGGETCQQIVNTDIDGLLTGALLYARFGWPVVGFSNTTFIWIDDQVRAPLSLRETAWVDLDMCMPGARCISQHIVTNNAAEAQSVVAFRESVNPNLVVGRHREQQYCNKYPYGTFQWAAWVLDADLDKMASDPTIASGLAWMPDGGFASILKYRANCLNWALRLLPGSLMSPLAQGNPQAPLGFVQQAKAYLEERSGVTTGWSNYQWRMTRKESQLRSGQIQALLNVIADFYGWRRAAIPQSYRRIEGEWSPSSSASPQPPDWPVAANRGEVISVAVTGGDRWCWTKAPPPGWYL